MILKIDSSAPLIVFKLISGSCSPTSKGAISLAFSEVWLNSEFEINVIESTINSKCFIFIVIKIIGAISCQTYFFN